MLEGCSEILIFTDEEPEDKRGYVLILWGHTRRDS